MPRKLPVELLGPSCSPFDSILVHLQRLDQSWIRSTPCSGRAARRSSVAVEAKKVIKKEQVHLWANEFVCSSKRTPLRPSCKPASA